MTKKTSFSTVSTLTGSCRSFSPRISSRATILCKVGPRSERNPPCTYVGQKCYRLRQMRIHHPNYRWLRFVYAGMTTHLFISRLRSSRASTWEITSVLVPPKPTSDCSSTSAFSLHSTNFFACSMPSKTTLEKLRCSKLLTARVGVCLSGIFET